MNIHLSLVIAILSLQTFAYDQTYSHNWNYNTFPLSNTLGQSYGSSWNQFGNNSGDQKLTQIGSQNLNTLTSYDTAVTTEQNLGNSQVLYTKPVITQTQELYSKPVVSKKIISQPIITQKIVQQPVIKQRIVQTPIVKKTVVSRPVYTEKEHLQPIVDTKTTTRHVPINVPGKTTIREKYYQPTVLTKDVQLHVNRGQTQINDMPVQTQPTQYSEEVVNKVVHAPAKEIYTQPIYQKQVINNTEKVEFQKQQPVYMQNAPIYRQPVLQERTRYETVTRPGREIYNNTYIQPVVQRENVDIQFNRHPDRHVNLEQVVQPAQHKVHHRVENVHVPGNQIITQPIVQKYVEQRDIHHMQVPEVQKVAVHRPFPVPTPVVKKVPVVRRIPVPVRKRGSGGTKIVNLQKVSLNGSSNRCNKSSTYSSEQKYYYKKKRFDLNNLREKRRKVFAYNDNTFGERVQSNQNLGLRNFGQRIPQNRRIFQRQNRNGFGQGFNNVLYNFPNDGFNGFPGGMDDSDMEEMTDGDGIDTTDEMNMMTDGDGIDTTDEMNMMTDSDGIDTTGQMMTDSDGIDTTGQMMTDSDGIDTTGQMMTDSDGIDTTGQMMTDGDGIDTTEGMNMGGNNQGGGMNMGGNNQGGGMNMGGNMQGGGMFPGGGATEGMFPGGGATEGEFMGQATAIVDQATLDAIIADTNIDVVIVDPSFI